ncbi:hypothetical protein ACFL1L_01065 [Thermoplasmatota archaeon]
MKIELDEKTIDNIVNYALEHPDKIRILIKLIGEESISVLMERKILEKGAKLYREITKEINYTFKK